MSILDLAKRFMEAVGKGDETAARACMHADAKIWHNYDGGTQTVDENMALMQAMITKCSKRDYEIHLINEVDGGYVQRHTLHVTSPDGSKTYSTEALSLINVVDGKIAWIEEFINPAPIMPLFAESEA